MCNALRDTPNKCKVHILFQIYLKTILMCTWRELLVDVIVPPVAAREEFLPCKIKTQVS